MKRIIFILYVFCVIAHWLITEEKCRERLVSIYNVCRPNDRAEDPVWGVRAAENGGNGVKITEVVPGLPGEKSGFEVGDIILEIDGTPITGERSYSDAIDRAGSVARMKIINIRNGEIVYVNAILNK